MPLEKRFRVTLSWCEEEEDEDDSEAADVS
jgi:hypothetical protein